MQSEIEDEFPMFEALQTRLAKKWGRKPLCPYCGQILGIGQMVTQRKVWLPTRPKGQKLVITFFHVLCWISLDGQRLKDEDYLRHRAFEKQRKVSFMTPANILSETGK